MQAMYTDIDCRKLYIELIPLYKCAIMHARNCISGDQGI